MGTSSARYRPGHLWITTSSVNEPVIRSLWATRSEPNYLTGITGMLFDGGTAPEDHFLAELDTIDLHHGPYSTKSPYTVSK
jgi:hypothetical protein